MPVGIYNADFRSLKISAIKKFKILTNTKSGLQNPTSQEEVLLNNGASVNLGDNNGVTPLMIFARVADTKTLECPLTHGADYSLVSNKGLNALDYASEDNKKILKPIINLQNAINSIVELKDLLFVKVYKDSDSKLKPVLYTTNKNQSLFGILSNVILHNNSINKIPFISELFSKLKDQNLQINECKLSKSFEEIQLPSSVKPTHTEPLLGNTIVY